MESNYNYTYNYDHDLNAIHFQIARMYCDTKSYTKAIALDSSQIPENNMQVHYLVGRAFEFGNGNVGRNYEHALFWYQKASKQGHAASERALGSFYFVGKGVVKDLAAARRWFTKAADHGHKLAQYQLGLGKNKKKAVMWYEKSAAQQHIPAMNKMMELTGIANSSTQLATRTTAVSSAVDNQANAAYQDAIKSWESKYNDLLKKMKIVFKSNISLNEKAEEDKKMIEKLTKENKLLNKSLDELDEDIKDVRRRKNDEIKKLERKIRFLEDDLEYDLKHRKKSKTS